MIWNKWYENLILGFQLCGPLEKIVIWDLSKIHLEVYSYHLFIYICIYTYIYIYIYREREMLGNSNCINTLRPRQNGHHFPDNIFKCTFLKENVWISIKIPLRLVPKGPINNIQIMTWCQSGDKPLKPINDKYMSLCLNEVKWISGLLFTYSYMQTHRNLCRYSSFSAWKVNQILISTESRKTVASINTPLWGFASIEHILVETGLLMYVVLFTVFLALVWIVAWWWINFWVCV